MADLAALLAALGVDYGTDSAREVGAALAGILRGRADAASGWVAQAMVAAPRLEVPRLEAPRLETPSLEAPSLESARVTDAWVSRHRRRRERWPRSGSAPPGCGDRQAGRRKRGCRA